MFIATIIDRETISMSTKNVSNIELDWGSYFEKKHLLDQSDCLNNGGTGEPSSQPETKVCSHFRQN
jgi:hypothetical protein